MSLTASIDLGTTSVRVCLYNGEGERVAKAQLPLSLSLPAPGIVEQDPQEFLAKTAQAFRSAVQVSRRPASDIDVIGVVSQRGTVIAWDSHTGLPLAPAISWQDQRTLPRVREIQALGLPLNTMASCTKFEWLVTNVDAVKDAHRVGRLRMGTPDVWLTWWLTSGQAFVTDPSNAGSTALYQPGAADTSSNGWSSGALSFFQQDPDHHPTIGDSSAVVGFSNADVLGTSAAVAARIGDQQSSCYANGLDAATPLKLTLGTSAMVDRFTGGSPTTAPEGTYALPLWRLEGTETFCVEGTVMSAGSTIEWLVRIGLLDNAQNLDDVVSLAQERTDESPLVIPAFSGLGTPHMVSDAKGTIVGIDLSTRAPDLVAAAVEGIAQRCAEVIETVAGPDPSDRVHVDGGLAQSALLVQRIADLSGRTILLASDHEMASRGGAMLAALAARGETLPTPGVVTVSPQLGAEERSASRLRFSERLEQAVGPPKPVSGIAHAP